jgi:hypothetical protein
VKLGVSENRCAILRNSDGYDKRRSGGDLVAGACSEFKLQLASRSGGLKAERRTRLDPSPGARMAHRVAPVRIRGRLLPTAVDFVERIDGDSQFVGDPGYYPVKTG